jgi:hypothetical protein
MPTAGPDGAACAADPIYAAIHRHQDAGIIWDSATRARGSFPDMGMDDEQARQCELLDEAVEAAWKPCEQAGIDLITTEPTTLAGIVAAIRYIQIQMDDDGTLMPHQIEFEWSPGCEGDAKETLGWIDASLDTIVRATAALVQVQS